jgi:hypothetical protein
MRPLVRSPRLLAWAPAIAFGVLTGCGGSTSTLGSGSDGGSGGPPGGDGASGPCPADPPASHAGCSGSIVCEYGSDPDITCDTVATCVSGTWDLRAAPSTPCSTAAGAGCPSSYSALTQQSTCSTVGTACAYPEARCTCDTHCGLVGRPESFWCCPDAPSNESGCPSPRPRVGSACATEGTVCDYGGCTGNVTLSCTAGSWQPTTVACPG